MRVSLSAPRLWVVVATWKHSLCKALLLWVHGFMSFPDCPILYRLTLPLAWAQRSHLRTELMVFLVHTSSDGLKSTLKEHPDN